SAVDLDRERQTGTGGDAVDENGAGATDTVLATQMRPRETTLLAEEVRECDPRFTLSLVGLAVHRNRDRLLLTHCDTSLALAMAFFTARATTTPATCRR